MKQQLSVKAKYIIIPTLINQKFSKLLLKKSWFQA